MLDLSFLRECHDNGKVALMWHFICAKPKTTVLVLLCDHWHFLHKNLLYHRFQFEGLECLKNTKCLKSTMEKTCNHLKQCCKDWAKKVKWV